jgi:hypothetical protein
MKRRRLTWLLSAVVVAVLAAAAVVVVRELRSEPSGPRPQVVLGSGSHEGLDWVYGYNVGEVHFDDRPCYQLVVEGSTGGCGRYTQPVETLIMYASSGGRPDGLVISEGVVADRVARVECGTGAEPIGETHLFEAPQGEPRTVLCLATGEEIAGREWFAFAYDARDRELARGEILPRR